MRSGQRWPWMRGIGHLNRSQWGDISQRGSIAWAGVQTPRQKPALRPDPVDRNHSYAISNPRSAADDRTLQKGASLTMGRTPNKTSEPTLEWFCPLEPTSVCAKVERNGLGRPVG
jgi:hypothetical protein